MMPIPMKPIRSDTSASRIAVVPPFRLTVPQSAHLKCSDTGNSVATMTAEQQ
jgi:hypothetical protein